MKAERVKVELSNLQTHFGSLDGSGFKMKGDMIYEEQMLTIEGEGKRVRLHARNIARASLDKKKMSISAMNFEIVDKNGDTSVVSGSLVIEFPDEKQAQSWYGEVWG
ncbi:MAG: hypothetical protein QXQ81_01480 [Candidatus Thorarchaeota archaeon]